MSTKKLPSFPFIQDDDVRMFSSVRLVAMDLDGTLVISKDSLLPNVVTYWANKLKHSPYLIRTTIATGRTCQGAKILINRLGLGPDTPFIVYNGAVVICRDRSILHKDAIDFETLSVLSRIPMRIPSVVYAYCACGDQALEGEIAYGWSSTEKPDSEYNGMPVRWDLPYGETPLDQPSAVVIHVTKKAYLNAVVSVVKSCDNVTYTLGKSYVEVVPRGTSKGHALKIVAKHLSLRRSDVLAIGDNDNDASMLKWAGIGVAVSTASPKAKFASKFVSNYDVCGVAGEVFRLLYHSNLLVYRSSGVQNKHQSGVRPEGSVNLQSVSSVGVSDAFIGNSGPVLLDKCPNISSRLLTLLCDYGLVPTYSSADNTNYVLPNDVIPYSYVHLARGSSNQAASFEQLLSFYLKSGDIIKDIPRADDIHSYLSPCIKSLIKFASTVKRSSKQQSVCKQYVSIVRLCSSESSVLDYVDSQQRRLGVVEGEANDVYSRSPQYMGSKRSIAPFIMESVYGRFGDSCVFVDLMCGSGAVSKVASNFWLTYASDSLSFCRHLALIQGAGFDRQRANLILHSIHDNFEKHYFQLSRQIGNWISEESLIFCGDRNKSDLKRYIDFSAAFDSYRKDVRQHLNQRVGNSIAHSSKLLQSTHCLFVTYFANSYFGIRQSAEIDSLRYALDELTDHNDKAWAIGALISTVSANGTTYGGHFAQPKVRSMHNLSYSRLSDIIATRSSSIYQDFVRRFIALASASEKKPFDIQALQGPWDSALSSLHKRNVNGNVVVYLDPPYTRDDYARYYHVLETLVKYDYPSLAGAGLAPPKHERVSSKFSSRDKNAVLKLLTSIITRILSYGWTCALSYSNNAAVILLDVINAVQAASRCSVDSDCTNATHKSHGGVKNKSVVEYLVFFTPRS